MRMWLRCILSVALSTPAARSALAQDTVRPLQLVDRGPRFISAPKPNAPSVDASDAPVLKRRVTLELDRVPLKDALAAVGRQAQVAFTFSGKTAPVERPVSVSATNITLRGALYELLVDTDLDVQLSTNGLLIIAPRAGLGRANVRRQQGSGVVAGRVTDGKTGQGVAQATVTIVGTTLGASTRVDGAYRITGVVPGSYHVTARRVGYTLLTKDVTVGADQTVALDFPLTAAPAHLDEVVATVTGDARKYQVGNLIETVRADSVMKVAPVTSLGDLVNARVPGVQVFQPGGVTGASPSINIRGQNSLILSNQPLLVIDGARVENSAASSCYGNVRCSGTTITTASFGASFGGRFNDINPEEIASVEVVKGPSAATLYGTDGANGVILITTKHGSAGAPRWDISAEAGALTLSTSRFTPGWHAWGHSTDGMNTPEPCPLVLKGAGSCVIDSVTHFSALQDPATTPVGTGNRQRYAVQVAGGASQTRYFVSGTYEAETAPVRLPAPDRAILEQQLGGVGLAPYEVHPNTLAKTSTRLNVTTALGTMTDVTFSGGLLSQETNMPDQFFWYAGQLSPGYRDANNGWAFRALPANVFPERDREDATHVTGSANMTWRPTRWFVGRATPGIDYSSDYLDGFIPQGNARNPLGLRSNGRANIALYTVDLGGTASTSLFGLLSSKTSAGAQYNHRSELDNQAMATNLPPGAVSVSAGAIQTTREVNLETIVTGGYVEQALGLNDRLFLTGGLRADGGSAFGAAFKTQLYPKVSASWLASDEPWMPRIRSVSSLRFRAAYGSSGVQPGATDALAKVALSPATTPAGTLTGGVLSALGNGNLKPEKQTEFEAGADLEAFDQRVQVEATYYNKRSAGALVTLPALSQLGIETNTVGLGSTTGTQEINIGTVRNRGYEISANVTLIQSRPVTWSIGVNGSNNQNRLLKLAPGVNATNFGTAMVGSPLFAIFDLPFSYKDLNGDGIIEPSEVTVGASPVYIGAEYPTGQLTAQTTVGVLRNAIQMGVQVDARSGVSIRNLVRQVQATFLGDARAENDPHSSLRDQAALVAARFYGTRTGVIEDGSFTRLREVSLTYTVPQTLTRALHGRNASVTLAGRNLKLWTRYTGPDPEVNATGSSAFRAYFDLGGAPVSQYWIARARVGL